MKKGKVIERNIKKIHLYGSGAGILITREAKALRIPLGSKVQVSAVKDGKKKYIVIEQFPLRVDE